MSKSTEKGKYICAYRFLLITVLQPYFCFVCRKLQQYLRAVALAGLKKYLAENLGSAYHWVNCLPYTGFPLLPIDTGGVSSSRDPKENPSKEAWQNWQICQDCNMVTLRPCEDARDSSFQVQQPNQRLKILTASCYWSLLSSEAGLQPAAPLGGLETFPMVLAVLWVTESL